MTSLIKHEIRSVEAECRELRDAVTMLDAWIRHWQIDVASNLKPTTESLDHALYLCRSALQSRR